MALRNMPKTNQQGVGAKPFLHFMHQFRAIAIIFVVSSHTRSTFEWRDGSIASDLISILMSNGTFLFVFIAGFLFQHLLFKFDSRSYYLTKLKYVILPYLIMGSPAIVVALVRSSVPETYPTEFQNWSYASRILWLCATGTMLLPLWFIPMISIIYLLGPLLAKADKTGRIYFWLPFIYALSLFVARPIGNDNPLQTFLIYCPVYILGMWTSRNLEWVVYFVTKRKWLLTSLWLALVIAKLLWFDSKGPMYTESIFQVHSDVINVSNIEKALLAFILIGWLYEFGQTIGSRLDFLAEYSFAIFFMHEYFILAVRLLIQYSNTAIPGNILFYSLYTGIIILLSSVCAMSIKKLLGSKSRFIMGS